MNNKGQMIMIKLLLFVMTVAIAVALVPAMNDILNIAQRNDALNCAGYNDTEDASYNYNSSADTNKLACLAIDLYIPYLLLTVLIGGVTWLVASGRRNEGFDTGGY